MWNGVIVPGNKIKCTVQARLKEYLGKKESTTWVKTGVFVTTGSRVFFFFFYRFVFFSGYTAEDFDVSYRPRFRARRRSPREYFQIPKMCFRRHFRWVKSSDFLFITQYLFKTVRNSRPSVIFIRSSPIQTVFRYNLFCLKKNPETTRVFSSAKTGRKNAIMKNLRQCRVFFFSFNVYQNKFARLRRRPARGAKAF